MRWLLWKRWIRIAAIAAAPACMGTSAAPTDKCENVSAVPTVFRCEFGAYVCFVAGNGISCTPRQTGTGIVVGGGSVNGVPSTGGGPISIGRQKESRIAVGRS